MKNGSKKAKKKIAFKDAVRALEESGVIFTVDEIEGFVHVDDLLDAWPGEKVIVAELRSGESLILVDGQAAIEESIIDGDPVPALDAAIAGALWMVGERPVSLHDVLQAVAAAGFYGEVVRSHVEWLVHGDPRVVGSLDEDGRTSEENREIEMRVRNLAETEELK